MILITQLNMSAKKAQLKRTRCKRGRGGLRER